MAGEYVPLDFEVDGPTAALYGELFDYCKAAFASDIFPSGGELQDIRAKHGIDSRTFYYICGRAFSDVVVLNDTPEVSGRHAAQE